MRQKIDALLDIHGHTLKPLFAASYFELKLNQDIFGGKEPTEERRMEVMKSLNDALRDIDDYASESEYLAGDRLTLADIQYYNNVYNLVTLLDLKLDEFEHLNTWYQKMSLDPILEDLNKLMIESFAKFKELNLPQSS